MTAFADIVKHALNRGFTVHPPPEKTSGRTYRAQRTIVQSLSDADLAEVSLKLNQEASALSGKEGA